MPVATRTKNTPIIIKRIPAKVKKESLSFNKIALYQINANPAPNKITIKAIIKKNKRISIFPPKTF